MLLQLEQDCLDVYKRKVEQAAKSRALLLQALSDAKLELSSLLSALGEKSFAGIVSNYKTHAQIGQIILGSESNFYGDAYQCYNLAYVDRWCWFSNEFLWFNYTYTKK